MLKERFVCVCVFLGGTLQQNGQSAAEIQEEIPLTDLTTTSAEKQQNYTDKLQFPRTQLQTITALGEIHTRDAVVL